MRQKFGKINFLLNMGKKKKGLLTSGIHIFESKNLQF